MKMINLSFLANAQYGHWSENGCYKEDHDLQFVMCRCNHLTNFALIMDVSSSEQNPKSLSIITFIGNILSIAGSVLTIVVHIRIR